MTIQKALITWEADNMLSEQQSSLELTLGNGWLAQTNNTATTQALAAALDGTKVLQLSATGAGNMSVWTTELDDVPVVSGLTISASGFSRTAVSARSTRLKIFFYDKNSNLLGTSLTGTSVADSTTVWTRITVTGTIPTFAAYARLVFEVISAGGAAELHYLDVVSLYVGALTSNFLYYTAAHVSAPDTGPTGLSLSGNMDLQAEIALPDWTPGTTTEVIGKFNATGNQRSYLLRVTTGGLLSFLWSNNGTAVNTINSTLAVPISNGEQLWVRVLFEASNGGNNIAKFYYSSDGETWTQLGTTVTTAGVATIFDSTALFTVGSQDGTTTGAMVGGRIYNARVYADLLMVDERANWSMESLALTATTVTDAYGNILTLNAPTNILSEWEVGTGDVFDFYSIERSDDTEGYLPIAAIDSMLVTSFDDWEGRRNTLASYRMRIILQDGSASAYTEIDTAESLLEFCGYQFTTNEDPTLNLEYFDEPDRVYGFPDPVEEWELYNRDYAVVYRGTENRGDVFTIDLWLYMSGTPTAYNVPTALTGRQAFAALKTLVQARVSYVCVLDQDGNRWLAALLMDGSKATRKEPSGKYLFPVRVRQTNILPSTPSVDP
jgi:hypothetical protein